MKIGLLLLMVVFVAVLVGLFIMSFKMLSKVRKQEKLENANKKSESTLHPKLQQERDQK